MILFISPKTAYFTKRLKQEAQSRGVVLDALDIKDLARLNFEVDVTKYQALYVRFCYPYFEQTVELAKRFMAAGKNVVDAAIAQGDVDQGKMEDYEKLAGTNIPTPKTERLAEAGQWQYPRIVKSIYGFGGKEVFLVKNPADLARVAEFIPAEELLLQEFIPAEYEYKVVTVGYKSLPVVLRFGIDQNNWRPDFGKTSVINIADVGADTIRPLQRIINLAEQSSRLLKRELAKVDILESNGKFYVLEVNRWPGLSSFEELTGYNAVAEFLKYLIRQF